MTYAQRFKAKVAEVMPEMSEHFDHPAICGDDSLDIERSLELFYSKEYEYMRRFYIGIAAAICAVIDHEESQNP